MFSQVVTLKNALPTIVIYNSTVVRYNTRVINYYQKVFITLNPRVDRSFCVKLNTYSALPASYTYTFVLKINIE